MVIDATWTFTLTAYPIGRSDIGEGRFPPPQFDAEALVLGFTP